MAEKIDQDGSAKEEEESDENSPHLQKSDASPSIDVESVLDLLKTCGFPETCYTKEVYAIVGVLLQTNNYNVDKVKQLYMDALKDVSRNTPPNAYYLHDNPNLIVEIFCKIMKKVDPEH